VKLSLWARDPSQVDISPFWGVEHSICAEALKASRARGGGGPLRLLRQGGDPGHGADSRPLWHDRCERNRLGDCGEPCRGPNNGTLFNYADDHSKGYSADQPYAYGRPIAPGASLNAMIEALRASAQVFYQFDDLFHDNAIFSPHPKSDEDAVDITDDVIVE